MLKIGLVRHAKSSWSHPDLNDHDRPLNDRGIRNAPVMAEKVELLFGKPELLISSTAKRALTTAEVFKKGMGIDDAMLEQNSTLYHASIDDMMDCISLIDPDIKYAMIFGHNPTTTYLANSFPGEMIDNVPTCGVILLESSADTWLNLNAANTKRLAFIYPKLYV